LKTSLSSTKLPPGRTQVLGKARLLQSLAIPPDLQGQNEFVSAWKSRLKQSDYPGTARDECDAAGANMMRNSCMLGLRLFRLWVSPCISGQPGARISPPAISRRDGMPRISRLPRCKSTKERSFTSSAFGLSRAANSRALHGRPAVGHPCLLRLHRLGNIHSLLCTPVAQSTFPAAFSLGCGASLGRRAEEMSAVLPVLVLRPDQAQPGLMHQGGASGWPGAPSHLVCCHLRSASYTSGNSASAAVDRLARWR